MDDLISRAAVLSRFKALQEYDPEYEGRGWACNFLNDSREPSAEWYCIEDVVEDVPAVDAIPVEWLRRYTAVGAAPSGERLTEGKERLVVHRILNDWQKEQEAR